ncbi:MAG: hypothetical protein AAFU41_14565 [Pseudomonadota bacterium]
MTSDLGNGVPIATLLGGDGVVVVGHLYLWESGDLGILWIGRDREISFIDRILNVDVLARARATDSAELVGFLETLPVKAS